MRRVLLLFNPASGRHRAQRLRIIEQVAKALSNRGIDVSTEPTEAPGTGARQSSAAANAGIDTVFACGGDGTVHEVLQGLAFHPQTSLAVIPLGSANALARHLHLSLKPTQAALQQLDFQPQTIPLGHITFQAPTGEASRYFLIMAGAGPDGALVYNMLSSGKHSLGRIMYYLRAAILFSTNHFSSFTVTHTLAGVPVTEKAVSAMSVRVADLGGLFSPLIRGASVEHPHLTLALVSDPARLSLPAWFALSWVRMHRFNCYAKTLHTDSYNCSAGNTARVQVQADGEWLGTTPMTVSLVPNALRILAPAATKDVRLD
jgi:YegS/Rv2252/BmrU family lipid kinase